MSYRVTPILGPDSEQQGPSYFDAGQPGISYQLGVKHWDSEGRERMWVRAGSSSISAEAQVTISSSFVATAGAGGWYADANVPANAYFHATKGTGP